MARSFTITRARVRTVLIVAACVAQMAIAYVAKPRTPVSAKGFPNRDLAALPAQETSRAAQPATTVSPALPAVTDAERRTEPAWGAAARAGNIFGTLTVEPNPVVVCETTGYGPATLSWTAAGTNSIEIRVGSPEGPHVVTAGAKGSARVPPWVTKGAVFLLQDATAGVPHTLDHTLARVAIEKTVNGPCE